MATLNEKHESREYNGDGSVTLIYDYRDAGSNTVAAYAALLASLGAAFDDLVREPHPEMIPVFVDIVDDVGHYLVRCRYIAPEVAAQAAAEVTVVINTIGSTRRITQAYAHINSYGTNPPDHKGAIGVTEDGPQGTDVQDPLIHMTVTRRYARASLPTTANMLTLRGKVNEDETIIKDTRKDRTWTIPIGELLCVGVAEDTLDSDGFVTVTFEFDLSENKTELTVGAIEGIAKKGWEHLWVQHGKAADGNGTAMAPKWVYIEQIYPTVEMNGIGLDGT